MTNALPNLDDMATIAEWQLGMPYLPLLTDEWLAEHPHPNYTEGWHLWCDIETKTTYIVQTAKHGSITLYAGDVPLTLHVADTDDYEYEYMPYEQYEAELTTNKAKYTNPKIDPNYALANYKVGYKWLADGTGYMIGNQYHTYGWWCLDDCLYNMMLFDVVDQWHLKTK
jgi:hypothetical protein